LKPEQWRDVVGYEGIYAVSNRGRVRRVCGGRGARIGHIFRPTLKKGYWKVGLTKNGRLRSWTVHRLVAFAFLSPPSRGQQVNHLDGNKQNNLPENLEWTTARGNMRHAHALGLCKPLPPGTPRLKRRKLSDEDVQSIRRATGKSQYALARLFGVSQKLISLVLRRKERFT
jgi:NUMOD4 motif/HNH endonuclease